MMEHMIGPWSGGGPFDMIEARLMRFGINARQRSALHACFRRDQDPDAVRRRGERLLSMLGMTDPDTSAAETEMLDFLDAFAALPESDFSGSWFESLGARWRILQQEGCSEDLPLRAAQALVSLAAEELLKERTALSALEVEVLTAVSNAGACVADMLMAATHRWKPAAVLDGLTDIGAGDRLVARLAGDILSAGNSVVGVLMIRLRSRSGALLTQRDYRDALMDTAMERIGAVLRDADVVLRTDLNGCSVVLPRLQTQAQVQLAAAKVVQVLQQPLSVWGAMTRAAFVVGVVWYPAHGSSPEELIRCADIAVETAEREERELVVFDETMLDAARQQAALERDFIAAMDNGQLSVHIQPQVDLRTRRCVGGELLLRWKDSAGQPISAGVIPDIAQRLGAAGQLTRWLVFGACRILSELIKAGIDMQLSVNLMARDLMDDEFPLLVEQAVRFWRVPPQRLMFELIESAVLEDPALGAKVMNRLLEIGVSTSIDDFGIGYSSILYLRRLPLDELKIDRVFVDVMSRSTEDQEIVAALIRLAHGLGMHVVAEGVENQATMDMLTEMGCDRAQGYWISRAMPTSELPAWFENWHRQLAAASGNGD